MSDFCSVHISQTNSLLGSQPMMAQTHHHYCINKSTASILCLSFYATMILCQQRCPSQPIPIQLSHQSLQQHVTLTYNLVTTVHYHCYHCYITECLCIVLYSIAAHSCILFSCLLCVTLLTVCCLHSFCSLYLDYSSFELPNACILFLTTC